MANYNDMLAVLRVVYDHSSTADKDSACNPCDTTGLAQATGLDPQVVADRVGDALRRGRMLEARETPGETKPYYVDIRLTSNGRAAVESAMKAEGKAEKD